MSLAESGFLGAAGSASFRWRAAREGIEPRKTAGYAWGGLDHLALRAALVGRSADAARMAGYVDAMFAAKGVVRQLNEAQARARSIDCCTIGWVPSNA
jgi:hypothetical protein